MKNKTRSPNGFQKWWSRYAGLIAIVQLIVFPVTGVIGLYAYTQEKERNEFFYNTVPSLHHENTQAVVNARIKKLEDRIEEILTDIEREMCTKSDSD